MKRIIAAGSMLAVLSPAGAAARPVNTSVNTHHRPCDKLFTVKMDERAANAVYRGTRHVTLRNLRLLGYMERCQRNPSAQWFARSYNRARWQQHFRRVQDASTPWRHAIASWYYDSGTTGCGFHATYGIATFVVGCGGTVRLKGPGGAVVTATRDDSGPYVGGRTFDLDPSTKAALGCGDLCDVQWAPTG